MNKKDKFVRNNKNQKIVIRKLKDREKLILDILYEQDNVSVSDLSVVLGVSVVTVRKDLDKLDEMGLIARTHGGAYLLYSKEYMSRAKVNTDEKEQIARVAADMIQNGDNVIIMSGTTTSLIAKFLYNKQNVHILTNSTMLLTHSRANPNIKVTLLGGEFLADEESLVGSITLKALDMFHASKAFIGCGGFSLEGGLTANHTELAEICRKIANSCDEVYLLADSSKFNRHGFVHIDAIDCIGTFITNTEFSKEEQDQFIEKKINVIKI